MQRLILFHHAAGIGKTMLTTNIADALRDLGHRILLVDLDPERHLTSFYLDAPTLDVLLKDAVIAPVKIVAGMYLSPADDHLREHEAKLDAAWETRDHATLSAISQATAKAAASMQADLIIYDLGSNLGALNRVALLDADFLITPITRDPVAVGALVSIGSTLARWIEEWAPIVASATSAERRTLPKGRPVFLGHIVSELHSAQVTDDVITSAVRRDLADVLAAIDPALVVSELEKLGNVQVYNLAQEAEEVGFPIVKLRGTVEPSKYPEVDEAITQFRELAKRIKEKADI